MQKQRLVVIGNGMAGARAVEEILSRGGGEQFEIVMFGDEPYGNYNRILLSNVMNGSQDPSEIFLNSLPWYRENNIRLHVGVRVMHIDRVRRRVYGMRSVVERYDKLIIATGSRAFIPPIENLRDSTGSLRKGAFGFRTLDDCQAIVEAAKGAKQAAVIGGGLLGLEAARGILHHGCQVNVIHLSAALMNQQLDAAAASMLKDAMEKLGVQVHCGKSTREVLLDADGKIRGLAFKDDTTLDCELVVVATGIKPNAELAMAAGLAVERAIVVDNHMRTEDPHVYAVGECAQHRGMVYGLVAPLWEQGKVLADHITGKDTNGYHGSKLATKLKVMGIELASMGITDPREPGDEVVQLAEPTRGRYKKLIIRNGRLVGAIMLGDLDKVGFLMQAFDRNTPLPDERLSLLFDLGAPPKTTTYDEMPAEAQVCNCNGITKQAIGACVAAGSRTLKAVMGATRAGMGCGSCKGMVSDLVGWYCGGAVEEDPSVHYYVPCIPLTRPALTQIVRAQDLRSVSAVFAALCDGEEDPLSKPALASLLSIIWKGDYVDERDARFINDRIHGNIQKDGTFSVIPEMPGGICTSDELRRIAEAADKYQVPLIKLTGGQRIDLVGVARDDLPAMWADIGMPAGYAWGKSYRTCKSCIGEDYCRFGLGDSMGLATKLEARFRGLDTPGKLKLATAGCPRNCSEALVKDFGAVAVGDGRWELYVGGAAGSHIRKGNLLTTVDSEEALMHLAGRYIQFYRENAKYKERTYTFVERVGIERIRAVVVDDSEGIGEALDRELDAAAAATYDPWLEREKPATANQFKRTLKVVS